MDLWLEESLIKFVQSATCNLTEQLINNWTISQINSLVGRF
ncbi:MAG: hypothetical protein ACLU5J_13125 [Christensenellales bacterium]